MERIIPFSRLDADPLQVGILAAQRAKLFQAGLPVAPGFVLTPSFFKDFIVASGQHQPLFMVLKAAKNDEEIHDYITNLKFPQHIEEEIEKMSEALQGNVSVTTSAAFHDAVFEMRNLPEDTVVDAIKNCWASLFHESRRKFLNKRTIFPTVIIQKDAAVQKSGVIYTHNPVNNAGSRMLVELEFPDKLAVALSKPDGKIVALRDTSKVIPLTDAEKDQLVNLALKAERFLKAPQRIEWTLTDDVYITEARNITKEDADYFFNQSTSSGSKSSSKAK